MINHVKSIGVDGIDIRPSERWFPTTTPILLNQLKEFIMKGLPKDCIEPIQRVKNTLRRIDNGDHFFWNITVYKNRLGLVKEHGLDHKNRVNWILTEKGHRILNAQI
jgi:hypothetical protein